MVEDILIQLELRMEKSLEAFQEELGSIRTGRATPGLVENIRADYAGTPTPIKHMANISVSGARTITIQPWDRNNVHSIEKAIQKSDLGVNPSIDGATLRLNIPDLTEDRRVQLSKHIKQRLEDGKVAIRNIRRDGLDRLKKLLKDKEISEDEHKRTLDKLQKLTDSFVTQAERSATKKEVEILEG